MRERGGKRDRILRKGKYREYIYCTESFTARERMRVGEESEVRD